MQVRELPFFVPMGNAQVIANPSTNKCLGADKDLQLPKDVTSQNTDLLKWDSFRVPLYAYKVKKYSTNLKNVEISSCLNNSVGIRLVWKDRKPQSLCSSY